MSLKATFTPGPWTERYYEVRGPDGTAVCEILTRPEDSERGGRERESANSRLICAAPDLIKAMRDAAEMGRDAWQDDVNWNAAPLAACINRMMTILGRAITTATGGEVK
jgi:hypothetical protein